MAVAFGRRPGYHGTMPQRYTDANKMTAAQAVEFLRLSRWKFYKLVESGEIKRYTEKPYVLGYYKRREIEAYKQMLDELNQSGS